MKLDGLSDSNGVAIVVASFESDFLISSLLDVELMQRGEDPTGRLVEYLCVLRSFYFRIAVCGLLQKQLRHCPVWTGDQVMRFDYYITTGY